MKNNKKFLILGFSPGLGVFLNAIAEKLHDKGAEAKLIGEIAMGKPVPKNFKPDEMVLEKIIKYENEFYNPENNPRFKNQIKKYATRCLYHLKMIIEEGGFTDLIVWNGQLIFTLAGIHWAEKRNMKIWYMENGALPGTLQLDEKGVNTESSITGKTPQFFAEHDLNYDTEQKPIEPLSPHPNKTLHPFELFARYINRFGWYWWITRVFWENFLPDQRGKKIRQSLPTDKVILPKEFVFIPLQVHDDTQIMVHSPLVKNMEEFVDACYDAIRKVDPDMPIVVKEHPQDFGREDYTALRQKYPDIIWLRKFPINDILAKASLVIAVNSGVGIEALTFKRPVITLGNAFYNVPKVVRHAQTLEELPELIRESFNEPVDSELINHYLGYLQKRHLIRGGWKKFSKKTLDDIAKRLLGEEHLPEVAPKALSKKPNVLYIIGNSETGGVPILIMTIIENLKPYFNFVLIAPNDGPYFEKFKEAGIKTIEMPIRGLDPRLPFAIAKKIKEYDIDLIHSHGKAAGLYSRLAGALTKKPVVHSFHGIHFKHHGVLAGPYCALERLLGKITTAFIATAEHERQTPIKMGWSTPEKIGLVRNAVPKSTIAERPPRKRLMLLSVGRFYPGKGQGDLIEAMPKIVESFPELKLVFVGGGSDLEPAKKLAEKLKVENNIEFLQNIPQEALDQYYAEAGIYISPSHGEGFSLTLAEAGQVGAPVIATDVTGNNEIVEHEKFGLLVPAKDPEKMAEAVIYLLKNPEKAELFANNLETKIKNDFSLESLTSKTTKFYNDVIENWKKKNE